MFGLADEIPPPPDHPQTNDYPVWRENWPIAQLFLCLTSQWDIVAAPDGELIRTGLKYDRVEVVLRNVNGFPRRRWPRIFADLRAMEVAALNVMSNARAKRRQKRAEKLQAEIQAQKAKQ